MQPQPVPAAMSTQPSTEIIHDLRNLFGVMAAAGRLLEDSPPEARRTKLLNAIESAAERGGQLTTDLLAHGAPRQVRILDTGQRLVALEPMIQALAGRASVRIDCPATGPRARLDPVGFDAAILELVANARAVLSSWNHIIVRLRAAGRRIWISVADDGDGMDAAVLEAALRGPRYPAAHGTGLSRVRHFAHESHGRMHIRSRKGRGTVVSLDLPMVISVAVDETVARHTRQSPQAKEKLDENRQPIAA